VPAQHLANHVPVHASRDALRRIKRERG
jgi:hypothetical protein